MQVSMHSGRCRTEAVSRRLILIAVGVIWLANTVNASADSVLVNGGFDIVGPNGSYVTVEAIEVQKESAALGWDQWAGIGTIITELLPTTDPYGTGNMLRVITDEGYFPPGAYGNGVGQPLNPDEDGGLYPLGGTLTFDIFVVSGTVTGGLVLTSNGNFAPGTGVFGPSSGWIRFTQTWAADERDVRFEVLTLGAGAEFYLENASFVPTLPATPVPEPSSIFMLGIGIICCVIGRRRPSLDE